MRANIRALEQDLQREFGEGAEPLRDAAWDNSALRAEAAERRRREAAGESSPEIRPQPIGD